ncbi:unnamed protein product [Aphanomyces euteiches]
MSRKRQGSAPVLRDEFEMDIVTCIKAMKQDGHAVQRMEVLEKAMESLGITRQKPVKSVTSGWYRGFMHRHQDDKGSSLAT